MNTWIIPNNPRDYDIHAGLVKYDNEIEWTKTLHTRNITTGDTVYIYESRPTMALTMKFVVTDQNIATPTQRHRNDGTETGTSWFKIRFLQSVEPIAYETLFRLGVVKGYIQGARRLKPEQESILNRYIETKSNDKVILSSSHMPADAYKDILLSKGFELTKSQKAYPSKLGEEYVFTHPSYDNQFYITRVGANQQYGFNPQKTVGEKFDKIYPHNTVGDKEYWFWTDDAFMELMNNLDDSVKTSVIRKLWSDQNITTDEIAEEIGTLNNLDDIQDVLKSLSTSLPPQRIERVVKTIVRNPNLAQLIKKNKKYICEICQREPFIQKNGEPYAEADHIEPLGGKYNGLDTLENMRCLCAQCHAIVTHGSDEIIRELLRSTTWQS